MEKPQSMVTSQKSDDDDESLLETTDSESGEDVWPLKVEMELDEESSSREGTESDEGCPILAPVKRKRKVLRMRRKKKSRSNLSYKCQECSVKFATDIDLALHVQTHFANQIICLVCHECFPNKSTLDLHMHQAHTETKSVNCSKCDKTFTYRSYVRRPHVQKQQKYEKAKTKRQFVCFFCNKKK